MALDTIRDVREAITAAESAKKELGAEGLWWRGHARHEWKLRPALYRPPSRATVEQSMMIMFQLRAVSRRTACPPANDHPAWLFLMQHYRMPTRLLDWTESLLTAVFFAVEDDKEDAHAGAIWALDPMALNQAETGEAGLILPEHAKAVFDAAFMEPQPDSYKTAAVAPTEVDLRLMVQLSVFTIHGKDLPLDDRPEHASFLRRFEIPADSKRLIREQLDLVGVRRANLFPDLENLARDIDRDWSRPTRTSA